MKHPSISFRAEKFDAGKSLECAILGDGTQIVFKWDVAKALGYLGKSQNWLAEFLLHISRFVPVNADLIQEVTDGIRYDRNEQFSDAITVETLIESCRMILSARDGGFLFVSELQFAKSAQIIIDSFDSTNWRYKIDVASGYALFRQNHIELLVRFFNTQLNNTLGNWILTIPHSLWERILINNQWAWADLNQNSADVAKFIYDVVFARIPESDLDELSATSPKRRYNKPERPREFIATDTLSSHYRKLETLLEKTGDNRSLFKLLLDKSLPMVTAQHIEWKPAQRVNLDRFLEFENKIDKALGPKPRF